MTRVTRLYFLLRHRVSLADEEEPPICPSVFLVLIFPKETADLISLATFTVCSMMLGLIARERAILMAEGTLPGTIAHLEATRAAMFAALLCILTAPWLIIAAIVLY